MISTADEFEIRKLIARNAELSDKRDAAGIAGQYAENAQFSMPGTELSGSANIRAYFSQPPKSQAVTRHMVMSPDLRPESASKVASTTYFQLLKKGEPGTGWTVLLAGYYDDIIERQADKSWRFNTRR